MGSLNRKDSSNSLRRHYPDQVLGYHLSLKPSGTPVMGSNVMNILKMVDFRFIE